jgi:hypothetical protein
MSRYERTVLPILLSLGCRACSLSLQVAVRCRPLSEEEEKRGMLPVVSCDIDKKQVKVSYGTGTKRTQKTFTYDKVGGMFLIIGCLDEISPKREGGAR